MNVVRRVVVFDARDIEAESTFWAGLLGGTLEAGPQAGGGFTVRAELPLETA